MPKTMKTMKPSSPPCELLSALADGELGSAEITAVLASCRQGDAALRSWSAYHLIGDALRSPAPSTRGADLVFLARLNQRLALENASASITPLQAAPAALAAVVNVMTASAGTPLSGPAANDGSFRWKLVAGFASMAAVAAIAWNASGLLASPAVPQLAQASAAQQVVVASPQGPVLRDARLEELLAAHRQLGGASALQVPSGFLRNATFETPQNARN